MTTVLARSSHRADNVKTGHSMGIWNNGTVYSWFVRRRR
jgi:alpha-tubulin suppressor-like RCC1 family protein